MNYDLLTAFLKECSPLFQIINLSNGSTYLYYDSNRMSLNYFYEEKKITCNGQEYLIKLMKSYDNLDELTKLPRRDAIDKKIAEYKKNNIPFLIVLFDIDKFKEINDIYGHPVGDKVLFCISNIVKNNIKKDDLTVRWGGDEFMVLMPSFNKNLAYCRFEEINKKIQSGIHIKEIDEIINTSISYGIIDYDYTLDFDDNYKLVDELLYEDKKKSKSIIKRLIKNKNR